MSNNTEPNEIIEIAKGFGLLMLFHFLASVIISTIGYIVGSIVGGYSVLAVWLIGVAGFFFWQLLYVIPLIIWLRRRGKVAMMKGVVIGAVLTALLNGVCFLVLTR